jgi:E3 ubiquitin-protein ligase RNF5
VIDLVDKTEVPPEILDSQEKSKNHVRLSTFDCVICMDSVKDLTVTHCGKRQPRLPPYVIAF